MFSVKIQWQHMTQIHRFSYNSMYLCHWWHSTIDSMHNFETEICAHMHIHSCISYILQKWPHLSSVKRENRCQLINIVYITFNYKYDKDSKLKKSHTITLPPKSYAGCKKMQTLVTEVTQYLPYDTFYWYINVRISTECITLCYSYS